MLSQTDTSIRMPERQNDVIIIIMPDDMGDHGDDAVNIFYLWDSKDKNVCC